MPHAPSSQSFLARLQKAGLDPARVLVGALGQGGGGAGTEGTAAGGAARRFGVRPLEAADPVAAARGDYVVYWMLHNRRASDNAALAVAQTLALAAGVPLLVVEGLTSNYPWASERQHAFVGEGVEEHLAVLPGYLFVGIGAHPSTERAAQRNGPPEGLPETSFDVRYGESLPANAGVLHAVFARARAIVTDWAPWYIFPGLAARTATAASRRGTPCLLVDDCGVVPLFRHAKAYTASRFIRPKLAPFLAGVPDEAAAVASLGAAFTEGGEWVGPADLDLASILTTAGKVAPVEARFVTGRAAGPVDPAGFARALTEFAGLAGKGPGKVTSAGGEAQARERMEAFLVKKLARYDKDRNHPDLDGTSRLSPYLHYGMIHPRAVVAATLAKAKAGAVADLPEDCPAATFLDELLTWRELGLDMAHYAYQEGVALGALSHVPGWAVKSLREHMGKALQKPVPFEEMEEARTPDPVWNAAQRELARTGLLHNYMRMVWGKGIVRWSATPEEALARLEFLNNKYALDGRDPNSYTGVYWCLGKFDRPWPPARPPFGLVRSMSSANARKKLEMEKYLARYP